MDMQHRQYSALERPVRRLRAIAGCVCLLACPCFLHAGDTWAEPHPVRREALTDGRDFDYNSEAFLDRLSYRYFSERPRAGEDGLRASGGSVTSSELYAQLFFRQTLTDDKGLNQILFRFQQVEDFDGTADRMGIGLGRYVVPSWRLALVGDVHGAKEETDIALESRWADGDTRRLRLAYIQPDFLFNSKTDDQSLRYEKEPETWFLHYREYHEPGWLAELAVNHSPNSHFIDSIRGIDVSGWQTRIMAAGAVPLNDWIVRLQYTVEWADRDYVFDQAAPPPLTAFDRDMREVKLEAYTDAWELEPNFGIRHFRLTEEGWFGDNRNYSGRINRNELTAFAGISLPVSENSRTEPTVYVSTLYASHQFINNPRENHNDDEVIGKLMLPWRYTFDKESGATFTFALSTYLHKAAFGGGNVQVHWPF